MEHMCAILVAIAPCGRTDLPTINEVPSGVFGQPKLQTTQITSAAPNLVEGAGAERPQFDCFRYQRIAADYVRGGLIQ